MAISPRDDEGTGATIIASSGGHYVASGAVFSGEIGRFSDPDPRARASDFDVVVAWGDGHTSVGTARQRDTYFSVDAHHDFASLGSYPVTFRVRSRRGHEATGSSTVALAGPNT